MIIIPNIQDRNDDYIKIQLKIPDGIITNGGIIITLARHTETAHVRWMEQCLSFL